MNQHTPDYEAKRLAALYSYHIADTLNETEYDDIAKLASAICGTPVSLVTFIDDNWQWFKAKVGTDFNGTPREIAFCEHTIRTSNDVMVIEDAKADLRFAENPLVTQDPNIRFYAGAAFTTAEGYALGTVCVLDVVPRKLSTQQIEALQILSRQVSALLETRKMNIDLGVANQSLKGQNRIMAGELQVLAAERLFDISKKNEELERINKELEAFAYITSHDLQEPLRKIRTFSSWLTEKEIGLLSDTGQSFLLKIGKSAARMQRLIQDLLHYSRVARSKIAYEATTLQQSLAPVLEDLEEQIASQGAIVEVHNDGRLFVIEYQFQQLLYNLLSNSLKFSKDGHTPQITISLFREVHIASGEPFVRIEFSDNGIGFDNQHSDRIFTLFQRLHSEDKVSGTGIGLTIVRQIVNNHGGTISARGILGDGATFTICLPEMEAV